MCGIYHHSLILAPNLRNAVSDDLQYGPDRSVDGFAIGCILHQDLKYYSYTSVKFEKNQLGNEALALDILQGSSTDEEGVLLVGASTT